MATQWFRWFVNIFTMISLIYNNCVLLVGRSVVELRLIMQPIRGRACPAIRGLDQYLIYAHRYDVVPQSAPALRRAARPELTTGMYVLKHGTRADGSRIGDVVNLLAIRAPAPLLPRFVGTSADPRLAAHNSLNYSSEVWLNKYHDDETFYALSLPPISANLFSFYGYSPTFVM
jgi:hypothetical protein